jgi:hypothetical protein
MCLLIVLMLSGPRAAISLWWLTATSRWEAAFDSFLWPFLGFMFLPWSTIVFVMVAPTGNIVGFDWLWLGFALAADVAVYGGSGYGGRRRY